MGPTMRLIGACVAAATLLAATPPPARAACTGPEVHVGTRALPPYTINVCEWDAASLTSAGSNTLCNAGFTIELWNRWLRPEFTTSPECVKWHNYGTNAAAFESLQKRETSVYLAGPTITAQRREVLGFVIQDADGTITIMTDGNVDTVGTSTSILEDVFSATVWATIGLILVACFLLGANTWAVDQLTPPTQSLAFPANIKAGIIAASTTAVAVLLGDKLYRPASTPSKVMKLFLTMLHMAVFAALTGAIVVLLSEGGAKFEINSFADTAGKQIGSVIGNAPMNFMTHNYPATQMKSYPTVDAMLEGLIKGEVSGIVYDTPLLAYHLRTNRNLPGTARLIPETQMPFHVGIAFQKDDNVTEARLHAGILSALADDGFARLQQDTFGVLAQEDSGAAGFSALYAILIFLGITTPATVLLWLLVDLRRLDKATGDKITSYSTLLGMLWNKVRHTPKWLELRKLFMTEEEIHQADVRYTTSFSPPEAMGPATLEGVNNLRQRLDKLIERLDTEVTVATHDGDAEGKEQKDADDDAADEMAV